MEQSVEKGAAELRHSSAESRPGSGWITTEVAAAALRVSPRTVRDYIHAGELEAISEGEGVTKRWLVYIDSVQGLREQRRASGDLPPRRQEAAADDPFAAANTVDTAELIAAMQELQYRLGKAEARVELQAVAESTLRESLDRERERADAKELEASQLRAQLEEARKSWWRRFFGL
jgi:hypothetical protein